MKNQQIQSIFLALMFATLTFGFQVDDQNEIVTRTSETVPNIEETSSADISGPTLLESGATGNWSFNSGPLYKWYYKEGSGISGTYTDTGIYHNSLNWSFYNGTSAVKAFMLKVEKFDKHGNILANYYYPITVYPEDCPGQLICM